MDPLCEPSSWPNGCAAREEAIAVLDEVIEHQKDFFLARTDYAGQPGGLYVYFAGEDPADELAARAGFVFRPVRVSFAEVAAWSNETAQHFVESDLAALYEAATAHAGWVERLRAIEPQVPDAGRPWLTEVLDGVEINGLRAQHIAALYEAVLAFRSARENEEEDPAGAARPKLDAASAVISAAEVVIRRREAAYRYPAEQVYGGGLTPETAVPNGTTYPYRVHTKTHLLTYWHNRQARAENLIAGGEEETNRVILTPVFAAPDAPLQIDWPASPGLLGSLDLGDGTSVGPSTTEHVYQSEGIFPIFGTLELEGIPITVSGTVARTDRRAMAPTGALSLSVPSDPVAVEFIRGVVPAFAFATDGANLAFATDASGTDELDFEEVVTTTLTMTGGNGFETAPADSNMELVGLTGPEGDPRFIGLADIQFLGTLDATGFGDPIIVDGKIVVSDVVDLLVELIGFDEQGALAFLAGVYGVPVEELPAEAPFRGEIALGGSE
jgi:hypothetical protein